MPFVPQLFISAGPYAALVVIAAIILAQSLAVTWLIEWRSAWRICCALVMQSSFACMGIKFRRKSGT